MKRLIISIIFVWIVSIIIVEAVVFTDVPPDGQSLNVSSLYVFYFNATDGGDNSTIVYSSDHENFTIVNTTFTDENGQVRQEGNISITPTAAQIGNFTIVFLVLNETDGLDTLVRRWNITANDAPVWSVLPNQTVAEDSGINGTLNLTKFVNDEETGNFTMNFSIVSEVTTSVDCDINATNNQTLLFTPADNYTTNGTFDASCDVRATDGVNNADTTIYFNVTSVNDPPKFNGSIDNSNLTINFLFDLTLNATDPDLVYSDSIQYFSNSSLIPVNNNTGKINLTTTTVSTGELVNISVNDTLGIVDSYITLFIIRTNSAPNFTVIFNTSMNEDSLFEYNFSRNVSDIDGDNVTFFDNTTLFNINRITGDISFTPVQADVGNHLINISVNDSFNAPNSTLWNITILNVNDFPTKSSDYPNQTDIPHNTARIGPDLDDHFSDEDGDTLTYFINGSASTNESITISIDANNVPTFTPTTGFSGTEYVTFTASDGNGGTVNSNNITLTVLEATGVTTTTTSGGGGGGTSIKEKSMSLDVRPLSGLTPNERVTTQVKISNIGKVKLSNIFLSATPLDPGLNTKLIQDFFPELDKGESLTADLIVIPVNLDEGEYRIEVVAKTQDTSAISQLLVSILSSKDLSRLEFIKDLLAQNVECAELTEKINQVKVALSNDQKDKARSLMREIEDKCRDLISIKREKPFRKITEESKALMYTIIAVLALVSLAAGYFIREFHYKKPKDKKPREKFEFVKK